MEYFTFSSSRKDVQLLPSFKSWTVSHFFYQFHFFIFRFVQIVQDHLSYLLCSIPFVCSLYAEDLRQFCQRFFSLDLSFDLSGFLYIQGRVLHNVDIAAGTAGNCPQKVSGNDNVCCSPADPSWRFRCDPAGTIGTETAAYALKTEAALGALSFYSVVGSFHGKAADKSL